MDTKVISLCGFKGNPKKVKDLVYIGRVFRGRGAGFAYRGSPYANLFKPDSMENQWIAQGRAVLMYAEMLATRCLNDPSYLAALRAELHGKYLACWCTEWQVRTMIIQWCHGIPLAMVAEGYDPRDVVGLIRSRLGGDVRMPVEAKKEGLFS